MIHETLARCVHIAYAHDLNHLASEAPQYNYNCKGRKSPTSQRMRLGSQPLGNAEGRDTTAKDRKILCCRISSRITSKNPKFLGILHRCQGKEVNPPQAERGHTDPPPMIERYHHVQRIGMPGRQKPRSPTLKYAKYELVHPRNQKLQLLNNKLNLIKTEALGGDWILPRPTRWERRHTLQIDKKRDSKGLKVVSTGNNSDFMRRSPTTELKIDLPRTIPVLLNKQDIDHWSGESDEIKTRAACRLEQAGIHTSFLCSQGL